MSGSSYDGQQAVLEEGNAADSFNAAVDPSIPDASKAGSRTLSRWISRYSSSSNSGSTAVLPIGSPPASSLSIQGVGGSSQTSGKQSFVRSLGSRTLTMGSQALTRGSQALTLGGSGASEDAGNRSSFRPVKTDDGEYVVWVEAFSLTFRCVGVRGDWAWEGGGDGAWVGGGCPCWGSVCTCACACACSACMVLTKVPCKNLCRHGST
jgi:hypothetical protein